MKPNSALDYLTRLNRRMQEDMYRRGLYMFWGQLQQLVVDNQLVASYDINPEEHELVPMEVPIDK